ncbi:MAG: peptide deformylase [Gammaproteobacteria bacterium]|jgi:peptide deformylase|nr:peptide deformylase [Gammaproteobacteria bacterium]
MAVLEILEYPDPRLRTKAAPVTVFDGALGELVDNLLETMYAAPGIGLAATQVDVHQRVLVVDVSEDRSAPHCLINPQIIRQQGAIMADEGCLSVPEIYEPVSRAEDITVEAQDRTGKRFELEATGLLAICIQHEMDHLEGKLFVDYLSQLKRERVRKKLTKARKRAPLPAGRGAPSL